MSSTPAFASQLSPTKPPAGTSFSPEAGPADILQACGLSAGARSPGGSLMVAPTQLVAELRQPCDVALLWIMDGESGNCLQASRRLTSDPIGPKVPVRLAGDLKQFDLVMERAVDYVGRSVGEGSKQTMAKPKKKMVFQATGKYVGTCAHTLHPMLTMSPVGAEACEPKAELISSSKIAPVEIVGPRSSTATAHEWLGFDPLWVFGAGNTQVWVVKAPSCGIPVAPPALHELSALVRAYPRDAYEFSFSLPAAYAYAGERSGAINLATWQREHKTSHSYKVAGQTTEASESSDKVNRDGSTEKSRSETKVESGYLVTKENSEKAQKDGKLTEMVEKTSTEEVPTKFNLYAKKLVGSNTVKVTDQNLPGDGKPKLDLGYKDELTAAVSLKKNGRELDATKLLNMALNVRTTFAQALESIKNMVPSVGWKITADIKVLEGSITINWGVQNPEDIDPDEVKPRYEYVASRYVAVRNFWSVDISCVVIGATLTLMVGVEVKVSVWFWEVAELIVKLEGKLSGEQALKWKCTSDVPVDPPALEYAFKGSISGVCKANAVGRHLIDASATLSGGFQVTVTPHVSFERPFSLEGGIQRLDTEVVYWGACGKEKPDPVKVPLYDKKTIWEGDLMGKTEKGA